MTSHDRFDADRLDDWLEGLSGTGRPTSSPNGHGDASHDLVGVAQDFHAEMRAAESRLPVAATRIWEDVMATTSAWKPAPVSASPVTGLGNSGTVPPSGGWFARPGADPERHGFMYWAVPVGMVAVVMFAIVAVTYLANRPDNDLAGITHYSETPGMAANTTASPEAEDIAQIPAPVECTATALTLEQIATAQANPGEYPARQYGPVSPADPASAEQVAEAGAHFDACSFAGDWRSMASNRLIADAQVAGSPGGMILTYYQSELGMTSAEIVDLVRTLSSEAVTGDWQDYLLVVDDLDPAQSNQQFINPDHVVMLADGRMGAAQTVAVSSHEMESMPAEFPFLVRNFQIFVQQSAASRQWVLDETLTVCLGECDSFFANLQLSLDANAAILTPVAPTPNASPAAGVEFVPITAEECDVVGLSVDEVSAIVRDPGEEPDRSYTSVGPADPEAASAALEADRAWKACQSFGSIGQKTTLQTPWLTANGPDPDVNNPESSQQIVDGIEERGALGETMLTGNELDYVVPSGQTWEEMSASLTVNGATVPATSGLVLLDDGRIAIPQITVVADDSLIFSEDWSPHLPYFTIPVHILAQDSETGEWLVDEVTWLCGGDCDQMITDWQEREAALLEQQSGVEPATPEATPAN